MKRTLIFLIISIINLVCYAQTWEIDLTKSKVTFVIDGPFGRDVNGKLSSPTGSIVFDPAKVETASFNVSVESNSIYTYNKKRDEHLKKEEFFDVANHKKISFVSTKVEKSANGFLVIGHLKMKDKSKLVKIEFTFLKAGNYGTWKGNLSLNRLDFGVGKSSMLVGDEVKINIELVALSK